MKVCSQCLRCYDDLVISCLEENHPALSRTRDGGCESVTGYQLEYLLEAGRNCQTYQARHVASGQSCLIKILTADEKKSQQFLQEARLAAALFHPNIADVYEAGSLESGELFVAAEKPGGQTLRDLLNNVGVPQLLTSVLIARQAAEALHAIHENGLTHRAVRPENIVITTDVESRLLVRIQNLDFGGVREHAVISNKFLVDSALDSLRYFAPEQCTGALSGVQTDVYSLGIVFFEMLAGVPPFEALTAAELIEKQKNQHPPDIKIDNFNLRMLVTHALMESLQKQPSMRTSSANAFARQLRHIEQLATHTSTPPPAVVTPPAPQRPAAVVAGATAIPAPQFNPVPIQPTVTGTPAGSIKKVDAPAVLTEAQDRSVVSLQAANEPVVAEHIEPEPVATETIEAEPIVPLKVEAESAAVDESGNGTAAGVFEMETVEAFVVDSEPAVDLKFENEPVADFKVENEPVVDFNVESEPVTEREEVQHVSVSVNDEPVVNLKAASESISFVNFQISVPDFPEIHETADDLCEVPVSENIIYPDFVKAEAASATHRSRLKLRKKRLHSKTTPLVDDIPEISAPRTIEPIEIGPHPVIDSFGAEPLPLVEPVKVEPLATAEHAEVEPVQIKELPMKIPLVLAEPEKTEADRIMPKHIVIKWEQPEDDIPSLEEVREVQLRDQMTDPAGVQPVVEYSQQDFLYEDDFSPTEVSSHVEDDLLPEIPSLPAKAEVKSFPTIIRKVEKRKPLDLYPANSIFDNYSEQSTVGSPVNFRSVVIGGGLIALIVSLLFGSQVLRFDEFLSTGSETAAKTTPAKQPLARVEPARTAPPAKQMPLKNFERPLPAEDDVEEAELKPLPINERLTVTREGPRTPAEKADASDRTPKTAAVNRNTGKTPSLRSTLVISSDNGKVKSKVEPEKKPAGSKSSSRPNNTANSTRPRIVANPRP